MFMIREHTGSLFLYLCNKKMNIVKDFLINQSLIIQALIAGGFTWFMTAAGAAMIFLFGKLKRSTMEILLGFAAGIMIAASFWSLLAPAIEISEKTGNIAWLPPAIGFITGALFLWLMDKITPHLHLGYDKSKAEGPKTGLKKTSLIVLAITLHNIPEGLAVGVAIGSAHLISSPEAIIGSMILAIGIGIQDFPEGFAVSATLKSSGASMRKSFMMGQYSGLVEPVGAVIGALLVTAVSNILAYALAFAAGAMVFITVEELIPEAQLSQNSHFSTFGFITGFVIMMILDVALG